MNLEKIRAVVAGAPDLAGWILRSTQTDSTTVIRLPGIYTVSEGRFVRHPNPFPREVINAPSEEVWVTVYGRHQTDGVEYMGEALGQFLSDDEAAVKETLATLAAAARSQPNKPYPLVGKTAEYPKVELADHLLLDVSHAAVLAQVQRFSDQLLAAAAGELGIDVSNLEVFIRRMQTRAETSSGVTVEFPSTRADVEVCFIARFGDKVAEHTSRPHARRLIDLDAAELVEMGSTHARGIAQAGSPPQFEGPVVLAGEAARNFLLLQQQPLSLHCGARNVYEKTSRYVKGKPVWGEGPLKGDPLTLFSDPLVPFGVGSRVETDAVPTLRAMLVENGLFAELHGMPRFYHYLGLLEQGLKPTGLLGNTVVPAGKAEVAELLGPEKTVVVRSFSDFQCDPASGDFASEIRLGELRDGERLTPFKGGLLIGNWFGAMADIRLSAETMKLDGYYGPSAIRVGKLQVAG
jgi:predicted Zn-dependent protease